MSAYFKRLVFDIAATLPDRRWAAVRVCRRGRNLSTDSDITALSIPVSVLPVRTKPFPRIDTQVLIRPYECVNTDIPGALINASLHFTSRASPLDSNDNA